MMLKDRILDKVWSSLMFGGLFGAIIIGGAIVALVTWDWRVLVAACCCYLGLTGLVGTILWFHDRSSS